ncbi:MAG TPA: 3-hydroxyacyl-ACP dehydratase FabZ family protein [Nannocystis sp.]|jgi:3-hydroxymyristoyl/3-hydroxydecanoyl-(acyl carrier protein) dehydratase
MAVGVTGQGSAPRPGTIEALGGNFDPSRDLEALVKTYRRRPVFTPGEGTTTVEFGRAEIERMLPHREPFLLVDSVQQVDLGQSAIAGRLTIDPQDPVFRGHFPGDPVYPGVLQVEAIGQCGIVLQNLISRDSTSVGEDVRPRPLRLLKVHHALFQGAVRPGEWVTLLARSLDQSDYVSTCIGQVVHGDEVKALAVFEVYLLD